MEKNLKKEEGMLSVLEMFTGKLNKPMDYHFNSGGKDYSLACAEDCLVAAAQRVKKAGEETLEDVRHENDYHKEQAALRLLGVLEAQELLSARFAEINQSYPQSAELLTQQFPVLKSLLHSGTEVWENIKDKA